MIKTAVQPAPPPPLIHWTVSVLRLIQANAAAVAADPNELPTIGIAHVAVLQLLWANARNPFDAQPTVHASYAHLAESTGCSQSYVARLTRELARVECLRKGRSVRGRGTAYTLLRPEHHDGDAALNPFDPSESEGAAAQAVELLENAGRMSNKLKGPKKSAKKKPKVKPSAIAVALENMAGFSPVFVPGKRGGDKKVRKASLPFSSRCGEWSAVRAAQEYIRTHGAKKFKRVCAAARARGEFFPTKEERARLFEHPELVAELLAEPLVTLDNAPVEAVPEVVEADLPLGERFPPEKVLKFLTARAPDEAAAVYAEHAGRISGMTLKELTVVLTAWQDGEARTLASVFVGPPRKTSARTAAT